MLKILKTKTAKISGLVVAFSMLAITSASALTATECANATTALTALGIPASTVSSLLAAQCGGGSTGATYDLGSSTLRVGSVGMYVSNLQSFLGITADGKFGPMTAAAVKAWQSSHSLTADGVVGPMTRSAMTSSMGSMSTGNTGTTGNTTGSTSLSGTAGTISAVTQLSQYSNEEVGTGQNNIKVYGVEVEASKEGDVEIKSMKVTTTIANSSGSRRIEDYVDTVRIWQGSTEVGTASAEDFTKNSTGNYSKTVVLNSGAVVKAGKKEKFYISFDAANLDSGDIDSETFTVAVDNIRFVDGAGVYTTDTSTGFITTTVSVRFVSFSTAADTEVKIQVSTSTPKEGITVVNTTADTDDVVMLEGTLKIEGSSDVWLDMLPFLFTTDATDVDYVTATAYLTIDGQEFAETVSSSASTTKQVEFDDLDLTLEAGKTYTFKVTADIADLEANEFDAGDKLKVELDATRRAAMTIENEQGDALTDGTELTGVALGEYQHFFSIAPTVEVVSKSITPNDNGSSAAATATAKMRLKITANGGTVYLNGDEASSTGAFVTLAVDGGDSSSSVSSYTYATSGSYTPTNSGTGNEYYTLNEGDTMYVDIEALVSQGVTTGTSAVLVGMKGTAVLFGTATTSIATRSASSMNWTTLTDLLKTGKTSLRI